MRVPLPQGVEADHARAAPGQFAIAGLEPKAYSGLLGRTSLLTTLPATASRRMGLHTGLRYTPKVS